MSKINLYSRINNLKLAEPYLYDMFYPIADNEFVIIDSGGKDNRYKHWQKVISLLLSVDKKIKIYQIGEESDPALSGVLRLNGGISVNQQSFLIKKSKCLLTDSSLSLEIAKRAGVPFLFIGDKKHIKEYFHSSVLRKKQAIIENKEIPKPEEIVFNFFKLFDSQFTFPYETVFIGKKYEDGFSFIDFVPNQIVNVKDKDFQSVIRMDLHYDEKNLINQLHHNSSTIITNREINLNILKSFKEKIKKIIYIIEEKNDPLFCLEGQNIGINFVLYSFLKEEDIQKQKLHYMDIGIIHSFNKENEESFKKINIFDINELFFLSNKLIYSNGKTFSSEFHYKKQSVYQDSNQMLKMVNDLDLLREIQTFWILKKNI